MSCLTRRFGYRLIAALALALFFSGITPGQTIDQKSKETGSISGRVLVGGKAVPGITVTALANQSSRRPTIQSVTDSEGRYRLFGLGAGTFQVIVLLPTLVSPDQLTSYPFGTGKMIILASGEAVDDVDLKLVRGGVITGRITDEEGKPVAEERVSMELQAQGGRPQGLMLPYANAQMYVTDDRGIYRIFGVPQGRYNVSVGNQNGFSNRGSFPRTYFGETTETPKGTVVEIGEGTEATNIDIRVGRRGSIFSVSGRVVDSETGQPLAGVRPSYGRISKEDPNSGAFLGGLPTNEKGEFRLDGLEAGHYSISVSSRMDSGNYYSQPLIFDILDHDLTNLELKGIKGLTISGVVIAESKSSRLALQNGVRVTASVRTSSMPPANTGGIGMIEPDGSFTISGLPPGKVMLYLYSPETPGSRRFSTRVEIDGVEQPQGFDLKSGQPNNNLKVFINSGTGIIRGAVKFENGSPPPEARMFVSLQKDGRNVDRGMMTDARGHFVLTDIPAGDYEVVLSLGFVPPTTQGQRSSPRIKQFATVADDAEVQVNFTVDLKPKEGGP